MKAVHTSSILRVVGPYILFAGLWIFFSDQILAGIAPDREFMTHWAIYKGFAFVLVTGLLLSLLMHAEALRRERLEKERQELQAQLIQSQKLESIGTLASGVAHEINNPIAAVKGYTEIIQENAPAGSQIAVYAKEISKASDRIMTIVKNLLAYARFETQPVHPESLSSIIDETLSLIRTVMRHDQIKIDIQLPEVLPPLKCRHNQIQQVIMNLLTNARDTLNEKYPGAHDNKRIMITAQQIAGEKVRQAGVDPSSTWLRVTVEDHGLGIPESLHQRILDPFFTTKPRDKGTGLGLFISHGIVKEHGGILWVESKEGQWSRVHVDLPLSPSPPPQAFT